MSLIKTYNKIAKDYSQVNYDNFWLDEFKIFKKFVRGKKIIDIGCGNGRDAEMFVKSKFDYTGIDISKNMLKIAKARVKKAKFKQMNFYNIRLPRGSFEGFWALASLLHVPKRRMQNVLRSIRNILTDQGVGFIAMKEKNRMDHGLVRSRMYGQEIGRYFAFWKKDEMKKVLEDTGFKIMRVTTRIGRHDPDHNWLCFFVRKA